MAGDDPLPPLNFEQATMAALISDAILAAEKCYGFHLDRPAMKAAADSTGVTPAQALGPEWKTHMLVAAVDAEKAFGKDPRGFCEAVWDLVGTGHKGALPTMLTKREPGK
jgi:hypothetical protein